MHRLLVTLVLMAPQLAYGWPAADQWVGIQKGGVAVEDAAGSGVADVVGDAASPLLAWYGEREAIWLQVRVSTTSYTSGTDVVGVGIRTTSGDVRAVIVESGVGQSGEWNTPCAWGADPLGTDASVLGVQTTTETDGTTLVALQVSYGDFLSWIGDGATEFEMIALHAGQNDDGDWVVDLGGIDEDNAWDCSDPWSDAMVVDLDSDGLPGPGEAWIGSDPNDADTDDDGRLDGEESLTDTDEDGAPGVLDCDSDGDGIMDGTEVGLAATQTPDTDITAQDGDGRLCFRADMDPSSQTDPDNLDTDGGGIPDGIEDWNFNGMVDDPAEIDPQSSDDDADRDGDTIADVIEGSESDFDDDGFKDYKDTDSDDDGIPDAVEFLYDTDEDGSRDYVDRDADGDGIKDIDEGTDDFDGDGLMNFRDPDSDGDGKLDGDEGRGDDDCDGMLNYLDPDDGENCDDKAPGTNTEDFEAGGWDRSTSYRDGHIGGGCASVNTPGSMWLLILTPLALLGRRIRWGVCLLGGFLATAAHGQSASLNAERFVPAGSNGDWTRLHPAVLLPEGSFLLSLSTSYARNPLVFHSGNGTTEGVPLLSGVMTSHLLGAFSLGRVQLGIHAPFVLSQSGTLAPGKTPLGDMGFSIGMGFGGKKSWAVGLWLDGTVPTGDGSAALGAGRPEIGSHLGVQWRRDAWRLLFNTGFQLGTGAEIGGLRVGPALTWGVGANWDTFDWLRFGVEIEGELWITNALAGESAQPGAMPTEWALVTGFRPHRDVQVTLSGGSRVGRGVGAPDVRGVLGVHWAPRFYRPELNPARIDTDGDGIVDLKDHCVEQPEDENGIRDNDGCPDAGGKVTVNFEIVDVGGRLVAGARVDLLSGEALGAWVAADGTLGRALNPGAYEIRVAADGFLPVTSDIVIPKTERHGIRLTLIAPQERGRVVLRMVDASAKPVAGAKIRVVGTNIELASEADGLIQFDLAPGAYEVTVTTEDGVMMSRPLNLEPGANGDWTIVLPNAAEVAESSDGPIQLNAKVFFPLKQTVLTVEAYQTLDSLVDVLTVHPEIRKVGINGHADAGKEVDVAKNLAEQRARVVYNYLVNAGVDPARLMTKGYGYDLPLQEGNTEAIHGTNRRVDFRILEFGDE